MECQYGQQQGKDMIPLLCEKGFRAKGWLGIILGSRLFYEFCSELNEAEFESRVDQVVKEIGERAKPKAKALAPAQAAAPASSSASASALASASASASRPRAAPTAIPAPDIDPPTMPEGAKTVAELDCVIERYLQLRISSMEGNTAAPLTPGLNGSVGNSQTGSVGYGQLSEAHLQLELARAAERAATAERAAERAATAERAAERAERAAVAERSECRFAVTMAATMAVVVIAAMVLKGR